MDLVFTSSHLCMLESKFDVITFLNISYLTEWCWYKGEYFDLSAIESVDELIPAILDNLSKFASEDQVNDWRNDLVRRNIDYSNRDMILEWYEAIRIKYGPRLLGHDSCIKSKPIFIAEFKSLSQFGTLDHCGWCSRLATQKMIFESISVILFM